MIALAVILVAVLFWLGWRMTDRDSDPSVGWWSNYLKPGEKLALHRERRKAKKDGNHAAAGAIAWMFALDKHSRKTHTKRREYTDDPKYHGTVK